MQNKLNADALTRECIATRMRMANRIVTKLYDDALRPFGLRVSQLTMLAIAESQGELRQSDVSAQLHLDDSTLSRNLERMREKGWLETIPTEDARVCLYRLSEQGRSLLKSAIPAWNAAQERSRELLGDTMIASLQALASANGFAG